MSPTNDDPAFCSWELLVTAGAGPLVHRLSGPRSVVLGRGHQADLVVEHPSISRRHAVVHLTPQGAFVEDLGSANGTRIVTLETSGQRTAEAHERRLEPAQRVAVPEQGALHLGSVVVLVRRPAPRAEAAPSATPVIATAPAMVRALQLVERVADSPLSVLLIGETGVGKDVMARALHASSSRRAGPFVAINCAALSENLIESELFGHERGAFTGASHSKAGLLEAAEGGTAFLDEVGELPLAQQSKLLRALEAREVLRVGALKPRSIDVRFVAATNRDPAKDAEGGTFRKDLYFRLSGITIVVPPLRERPEDIAPLARSFVIRAAQASARPAPRLSEGALAALRRHRFPGNVRELRNVVERAVALADSDWIEPEHLLLDGDQETQVTTVARPSAGAELEKSRIVDALARCGGNQTRAAALLGISRRTLVTRLGEHGISRPRGDRNPE